MALKNIKKEILFAFLFGKSWGKAGVLMVG
nr:MAG: hypothetical protein [Bacteriophage sp.]